MWIWTEYGLVSEFIDHLHKPLGTTNNYRATGNLHALRVTLENTKSSPALIVFNSRFLVTDINSGDSSASRAQVLPVRRISRNWNLFEFQSRLTIPCRAQMNNQLSTLSIPLSWPAVLVIQPRGGPNRKHRLQLFFYFCRRVFTDPLPRNGLHHRCSIVACVYVAGVTYQRLLFTESPLSHRSIRQNINIRPETLR